MGHLLRRVEEVEEVSGKQSQEISDMKMQMRRMQNDHRDILYKLEEQENQSRRQNLRIRALPEQQGEDLLLKMKKILNPILDRGLDEDLKIDRVHRVRKTPGRREEIPRDVIVKFHLYEDKTRIWGIVVSPVKFENTDLQIFSDLSAGTLARRRQLKPLLEQPRAPNIKYSWGFPAALLVMKEGRTVRLKFPEDLQDFCRDLDIPVPNIL